MTPTGGSPFSQGSRLEVSRKHCRAARSNEVSRLGTLPWRQWVYMVTWCLFSVEFLLVLPKTRWDRWAFGEKNHSKIHSAKINMEHHDDQWWIIWFTWFSFIKWGGLFRSMLPNHSNCEVTNHQIVLANFYGKKCETKLTKFTLKIFHHHSVCTLYCKLNKINFLVSFGDQNDGDKLWKPYSRR